MHGSPLALGLVSCVYDSLCTTHLLLGLSALKEEEEKLSFSFLGYGYIHNIQTSFLAKRERSTY